MALIYLKNSMKPIILSTIIAVAVSQCAIANAQRTLTLDECRELALKNNAAIKKADLEIEGAEQTKKSAFTNYFPSISGSAMAYNADKGLLQVDMGGMEMSFLKNGVGVGVTAVQPVFAGGQIVNGNKLANVGVEVSKLQKEQSEKEISLTTEKYYWQIVSLKEKRNTLEAIGKMLKKLDEDVTAAVDAGIRTRNDMLQVRLKQNDVESNLINLNNGINLSCQVLAQYIGMTDSIIDVADGVDITAPVSTPQELLVDHHDALDLTTEYRLLEKNVKANEIQYNMEVGKNLPTVAVGAGYMYDNLMDKDHSFGIVFASVSVPITDWWGGSHSMKQKKSKVAIAKIEQTDNSELLIVRMTQTWNNLDNAYKQIGIASKSIDQAEENLRLNNDYYAAGTISMSDLLEAQTLYQQSRDKYVEAWTQYQIRRIEYLQATGR